MRQTLEKCKCKMMLKKLNNNVQKYGRNNETKKIKKIRKREKKKRRNFNKERNNGMTQSYVSSIG